MKIDQTSRRWLSLRWTGRRREPAPPATRVGSVRVCGLKLADGQSMPDLIAGPGDRIAVATGDDVLTSQMLDRVAGLPKPRFNEVVISGHDLTEVAPHEVRALVDYLPRAQNARLDDSLPVSREVEARRLLERVILDPPPLLVLDHLDSDLGVGGRATVRLLVRNYPGVVIMATSDPELIATATKVWRTDGLRPASSLYERARRPAGSAS